MIEHEQRGACTIQCRHGFPVELDRPIMDRLVPYGEPWRLGANEATVVQSRDVGAGTVPVETLEETVETLTIDLRRIALGRAEIRIEWERTGVAVPIRRHGVP